MGTTLRVPRGVSMRRIVLALGLALGALGQPHSLQAQSAGPPETYAADENGWVLDRPERDVVLLRTALASPARGTPAGVLMLMCDRTASKLVVSLAQAGRARSVGLDARGSASISVQLSGSRRSAQDIQLMAAAARLGGESFELTDFPSASAPLVGALARQLASGARQITVSLFFDSGTRRFEKDRVVRLQFPAHPDTEPAVTGFQIACLELQKGLRR